MKWKENLGEVYGRNRKPRQRINAAIRAEIPGGDELLESLEHFGKLHRSLMAERRSKVANIQQMIDIVGVVLDQLHEIREAMAESIIEKYSKL